MTDVSKIQGPSGSPDNLGKKDNTEADADKFKEALRKRVSEVSKIDPDEQKKRKRGEEAEEEEEMTLPENEPATPKELITPFSLEQETKKASPLEQQGRGISPMQSAQPTKTPSASEKTAFFQAPSAEEMSDDSGLLEEESFGASAAEPSKGMGKKLPSATPKQTPPRGQMTPPPTDRPEEKPATGQGQKPLPAGPAKKEATQATQKPGMAPIGPPQQKKMESSPEMDEAKIVPPEEEEVKPPITGGKKPPQTNIPPSGMTAANLETTKTLKEEDTSAFFEQMSGAKEQKQATPIEKKTQEAALQGVSTPPPPSQSMQIGEEEGMIEAEKKEKNPSEKISALPMDQGQAQPMAPEPPSPEVLPPYANMHPQVQELFDRMVGVMTVMNLSGMTETVMTLNSPQFASSVFFGTQIIIQEFSTAPQTFNIQLNGSAQAVALFQGNADDLMAAFAAGNYNFRINRLETGYLAERPLFKRKEGISGENQDQTGDKPR